MITLSFAQKFAKEWVESWNAHDLDRILSHYDDNFVIESPLALKRFRESKGTLKGKTAIRKYWAIGLQKNPNLEFEIIDVLLGVNSLSIYYLSKTSNKRVVEVLSFSENGKVNKAIVNYT